jgi:inner membrane protein
LALAEHVAFIWAYVAACVAIIGMITLYTCAALRSFRRGAVIGALLSALYGVLFVILRMEDYALLAGTGLLLVATAAVMYATRNVQVESAS